MNSYSLIQYEIRHKPLLGFTPEVRHLATKYFSFFDQISVSKEGTPNEQIELKSSEDGYQVILSRENTYLRFDAALTVARDKHFTPVKTFFSIVQEIYQLDTFSEGVNHLLLHLHVAPNQVSGDDNVDSFLNAFITDKGKSIFERPNDAAFVIESSGDGQFAHISAGPYTGLNDIGKRGVQPLNMIDLMFLRETSGMFYEVRLVENIAKPDIAAFSKLVEQSLQLLKKVKDE